MLSLFVRSHIRNRSHFNGKMIKIYAHISHMHKKLALRWIYHVNYNQCDVSMSWMTFHFALRCWNIFKNYALTLWAPKYHFFVILKLSVPNKFSQKNNRKQNDNMLRQVCVLPCKHINLYLFGRKRKKNCVEIRHAHDVWQTRAAQRRNNMIESTFKRF